MVWMTGGDYWWAGSEIRCRVLTVLARPGYRRVIKQETDILCMLSGRV